MVDCRTVLSSGTIAEAARFLNRRAANGSARPRTIFLKPPSPDDGRGHTSGFPAGTQREAQALVFITGCGSAQASVAERPVALPPATGNGAHNDQPPFPLAHFSTRSAF